MSSTANHGQTAERLGISPRTLTRWVAEGCPQERRGASKFYDLGEVMDWAESAGKNVRSVSPTPQEAEVHEQYMIGRARKVIAEADMAEHRAIELQGEMVRRSHVDAAWREVTTATRRRAERIPGDVAESLVGLEAGEIEQRLTAAVAEALNDVAESVAA